MAAPVTNNKASSIPGSTATDVNGDANTARMQAAFAAQQTAQTNNSIMVSDNQGKENVLEQWAKLTMAPAEGLKAK